MLADDVPYYLAYGVLSSIGSHAFDRAFDDFCVCLAHLALRVPHVLEQKLRKKQSF